MIRPTFVALFTTFLAVPSALAQNISLVSVSTTGVQGNNSSLAPAISADGRYVAFISAANTLVPGDSNPVGYDVFVRDRQSGTTTLASVSSNGSQSNGQCGSVSISSDGRYVAFGSAADNLVLGDTNAKSDVFVHDMLTGATTRVSVDSAGNQGNDSVTGRTGISADGRYVVFANSSSNLVVGDTNAAVDVFVHDRQTGITTRVSVDSAGAETGGGFNPAISADGRYVSFDSSASNLVSNDLNHVADVFVHDMQTGVTERVSLNSAGTQGRGLSMNSALSADGRVVAFQSSSATFVPGGIPRVPGVFLRDRQTGITSRESVSSFGAPADIEAVLDLTLSHQISISADARFVVFVSAATNLVPGDTNQFPDVFVHDNQTGSTVRVNVDAGGMQGATGAGTECAISANGRVIAFESRDALVPGDTNNQIDIYTIDNPLLDVGMPVCGGSGTGTTCPCGNNGAPLHGCANSIEAGGASLSGNGVVSVSNDSFVLTGTGLPDSSGLYFQGDTLINSGVTFGDGLRCITGSIRRLGVVAASGHASQFPMFGTPISVIGNVQAGDVRYYQLWYRDPNATFCTSSLFNLTNALQIQWAP